MQRKSPTRARAVKNSCVFLERGRMLQHVASYEDTSEGDVLRYWLKTSGLDAVPLCCLCGAHKATRGAHLFGIRLPSVVIVPACNLCDMSNVSLALPVGGHPGKGLFDLKCRPMMLSTIGVFASADILDRIDAIQRQEAAAELASVQRHQESIRRQLAAAQLDVPTLFYDQDRAATPLPPSPLTDPEELVLAPVPIPSKPKLSAPAVAGAAAVHKQTLKEAAQVAPPKPVDFTDATPRPSRRRSEAPGPKLFQQVGGCKICDAPVCNNVKACPGKSKTFCCDHCKCRGSQRGVGSQDLCRRKPATAAVAGADQ